MWAILTGVQSKFYVIEFTSFCSHSKFQTVAITSEGLANQNVMGIIRSINRALDNSHVLLLNNYLFYMLGRWRVCIYNIVYIYIYLIIFIYVYIETVDCPLSGWIFLGKKNTALADPAASERKMDWGKSSQTWRHNSNSTVNWWNFYCHVASGNQ